MGDSDACFLESKAQCVERNIAMLQRFRRAGMAWERCRDITVCTRQAECAPGTPCPDACWLAMRTYRTALLPEAERILREHPGPLWFVTLVHPAWEVAIGRLSTIKVGAASQWLYRRLRDLQIHDLVAVGAFEVSVNINLGGTAVWAGHFHLVVGGASEKTLKDGLALEPRYRIRPHIKSLKIQDVGDLPRQLGYSLKRIAKKRVAYVDGQGRQNRREIPPHKLEQLEFDSWLLGIPVGGRTFLFACRRYGRKLRRIDVTKTRNSPS